MRRWFFGMERNWSRPTPARQPYGGLGKRGAVVLLIFIAFAFGFVVAPNAPELGDADFFLKINKSIELFGRTYKEVTLNYVDQIEPEKLMRAGIDGMLGPLDPYTTFIGEGEGDEIELLTTGKYGGIGITVGVRDGYITITSLMEGYSAQRQGLQVGDRLIEIEGVSLIGAKPEQVRSLTRGEPGTVVRLKVEREGEPNPLEFVLIREEIKIKNISFAEFLDEGIVYIKLDRFSRSASEELRTAIRELKLKGTIKGVILDVRENPGGLLDVAVEIVSKFVPRGSLVVSTKGRKDESVRKFFAQEEPLLPNEPLVVLVNRNSASASEIVAGAIQDLDRGVILGVRTFGKGLVQTVTPLPYGSQLKITTAKYYTPSGRSIQEIDYIHKSKDGLFMTTPDSLKREFRTLHGRPVFELGGISPDTLVQSPQPSSLYQELLRKSMFFKFATQYVAQRGGVRERPMSDEELLSEFRKFVADRHFIYQEPGEAKLKELRELAEKERYSTALVKEIEDVASRLNDEKERAFEKSREEILRALKMEIAARFEGEKGRIRAALPEDIQVRTAVGLVRATKSYEKILAGK